MEVEQEVDSKKLPGKEWDCSTTFMISNNQI